MVPGRSPCRSKRHACLCVGTGRFMPAHGEGQPPRFRASVRCHLPGPWCWRGHHHARGQYRSDERTSQGNQHAGHDGCPRRIDPGWGRLASDRWGTQHARQHHLAPLTALCTGIEPDGERLGVSARQQALRCRLGHIRRYCRGMPGSLGVSDQRRRSHPVNRNPRMGVGQWLGWLVLQTSMDMFYLWGAATLPVGLTYADYAHRGAYPLVVTALLAGWFAIVTTKPGTEPARSAFTQRLTLLWIGQNLLLVVSS